MTDNRILTVDLILRQVAEELDIPPGKYQEAVERYSAVGRWLEDGIYPGTAGRPDIYVQGSFRLGTVVRPLKAGREADYDIDLACQFRAGVKDGDPREVKHWVGNRLKEHGTYKSMLEQEGRRCWTLVYAEQDGIGFHLDNLPCLPNPVLDGTVDVRYGARAIEITNRDRLGGAYSWAKSNPNGFADWFADRQHAAFVRIAKLRKSEIQRRYPVLFESVADVPDQLVRTPLQRVVQLLKRHRDVRFLGHRDEGDKPISIIITVLAALAYQQESDVFSALVNVLDKIQRYQETGLIRCVDGKWTIENPTNPGENFAERWNDEGSRKAEAFFTWISWLQEDLDELLNASTAKELDQLLRRAFGDGTGGRIAGRFSGQLPGAYQPKSSIFRRMMGHVLRFDVPHREVPRWSVRPTHYSATIKARFRRNGFRPTPFFNNSQPLRKGLDLDFEVETNVPKPYTVHWQVVNTGDEAHRARQLRGDFYGGTSSRTHTETTKFRGMHWVEGFVVKDGTCVARTGEFVVNID